MNLSLFLYRFIVSLTQVSSYTAIFSLQICSTDFSKSQFLALYKAQLISLHWKRDNSYKEFNEMLSATGIFDFSSKTAERNLTKLNRKQDLNVLYQFCVFGPIRKTRWMSRPLIGWFFFLLLFRNRRTEFKLTWQVARSNSTLPILRFSGISKKARWRPRPLIGWDIFNVSSETTEWNSMKLDRKQDPHVLFQDCVFRAEQ